MKHEYDWSKLDAGWEPSGTGYWIRWKDGGGIVADIASLECESPPNEHVMWTEFKNKARAQLAKCRVKATNNSWRNPGWEEREKESRE